MSYLQNNRISQNLYLRDVPIRKYAPQCLPYCPSYIPPRNYCFIDDCCCCHCCCCCCHCYNVCCEPRPRYNFSSRDLTNKYLNPKKEEENKIKNSQNQGQNEEQKEEIEPPKEEIKEEQNEEQNEEPKEEQKEEPKENKDKNEYENYEQNQFNEFMKKLMKVESQIEETKNNLGKNPDFNCEDAFRLFESNNKGYLDLIDIKNGLNSLGINPTEQELNLLMKRFDLQKNKFINYADFFDMVVPFEKNLRQEIENRQPNLGSPEAFNEKTFNDLKGLFELIIKTESDINNDRKTLGTLRLKLKDIFALLDKNGKGYFDIDEMMVYFANNGILDNNKEADLLFIRLDKNRNGKIDYNEVEDELQTLF